MPLTELIDEFEELKRVYGMLKSADAFPPSNRKDALLDQITQFLASDSSVSDDLAVDEPNGHRGAPSKMWFTAVQSDIRQYLHDPKNPECIRRLHRWLDYPDMSGFYG
jgi:hypothetical protein